MKVFVINLDRCPDRLARVKARLDALGVPFERVAGVDEATLDPAERTILETLRRLNYGTVTITVHEGKPTMMDVSKKIKL